MPPKRKRAALVAASGSDGSHNNDSGSSDGESESSTVETRTKSRRVAIRDVAATDHDLDESHDAEDGHEADDNPPPTAAEPTIPQQPLRPHKIVPSQPNIPAVGRGPVASARRTTTTTAGAMRTKKSDDKKKQYQRQRAEWADPEVVDLELPPSTPEIKGTFCELYRERLEKFLEVEPPLSTRDFVYHMDESLHKTGGRWDLVEALLAYNDSRPLDVVFINVDENNMPKLHKAMTVVDHRPIWGRFTGHNQTLTFEDLLAAVQKYENTREWSRICGHKKLSVVDEGTRREYNQEEGSDAAEIVNTPTRDVDGDYLVELFANAGRPSPEDVAPNGPKNCLTFKNFQNRPFVHPDIYKLDLTIQIKLFYLQEWDRRQCTQYVIDREFLAAATPGAITLDNYNGAGESTVIVSLVPGSQKIFFLNVGDWRTAMRVHRGHGGGRILEEDWVRVPVEHGSTLVMKPGQLHVVYTPWVGGTNYTMLAGLHMRTYHDMHDSIEVFGEQAMDLGNEEGDSNEKLTKADWKKITEEIQHVSGFVKWRTRDGNAPVFKNHLKRIMATLGYVSKAFEQTLVIIKEMIATITDQEKRKEPVERERKRALVEKERCMKAFVETAKKAIRDYENDEYWTT